MIIENFICKMAASVSVLTHCGLNKMAVILQKTLSNAFVWNENSCFFIQISFKFVLNCLIDNESALSHKQMETLGCILGTVATDALVLKHQAFSIHSAD